MRIIAGEFRGRKLLPPDSDTTRPVTDRVKQSVFDILSPMIDGAIVYDCFAGTGSMGLECLSRGASHVTFFEADRSAANRLKKNIAALNVADRCRVVTDDLFVWFTRSENSFERIPQIDLVFLDPPYRYLTEMPDALHRLSKLFALHHLKPQGTLVFRHDVKDSLALDAMKVVDVRQYGSMAVEFLRPDASGANLIE